MRASLPARLVEERVRVDVERADHVDRTEMDDVWCRERRALLVLVILARTQRKREDGVEPFAQDGLLDSAIAIGKRSIFIPTECSPAVLNGEDRTARAAERNRQADGLLRRVVLVLVYVLIEHAGRAGRGATVGPGE